MEKSLKWIELVLERYLQSLWIHIRGRRYRLFCALGAFQIVRASRFAKTRAPLSKKRGPAPRSVGTETAQECHDVLALIGVVQKERMRRVDTAAWIEQRIERRHAVVMQKHRLAIEIE